MDPNATLADMIAAVDSHGERFSGGVAGDMAQDWIDHGFLPPAASEWMAAGFWEPSAAGMVRDLGLTPAQAVERAEALIEDAEDAAEEYTDGDPIYSICNGDTAANVLLGDRIAD